MATLTVITFAAPDPAADYQISVVDVRSLYSFSPSAGTFVAKPADELIKMDRDPSPNRTTLRYAVLTAALTPPAPGQYLVYVHPAAGGEPVAPPFPLLDMPASVVGGHFAVSF